MKRSRVVSACLLFVICFAFGFLFFQSSMPDGELDLASRAPAARIWILGGYLPENPAQKVYLTISDRTITAISPQRPAGDVVDTESLIFPGLMDMHNHIKYNVLPLWGLAKSQFNNRFEWRKIFEPYKDAVSFNMVPFAKGSDTLCAAVRWAEVKALTGGTTSIQGIGGDTKCATAFGPMNLEISGELTSGKIRAGADILDPELFGAVYLPSIYPELDRRRSEWASAEDANQTKMRAVYDSALMNLLNKAGVMQWLDTLANQPRNLANGIKLMIGLEIPNPPDSSPASFDKLLPQIQAHLVQKYQLKDKKLQKQIAYMRVWLYGKTGKDGYLMWQRPAQPLKDAALLADSKTMDFFGKGGVITLDPKVRRYLAMFETPIRRSILSYLDSRDKLAIVAHLAEGRNKDEYNRMEYKFAYEMGYVRPGLVMIHGVGLSEPELDDAGRRHLSIVWSPFSNLLLYGETLDVVTAKKKGVNIAMGPDWSPTGSKNMLDEIKIARRYLNKMKVPPTVISDKDIVDMATINGARALNLDRSLGKVAPGYMANLLLVDRNLIKTVPKNDPYSALIAAGQEHVTLVTVAGEPLYGDVQLIQNLAQKFRDPAAPEVLPRNQQLCKFQKGMRMPWFSPYDREAKVNLHSVEGIEKEIRSKMAAYGQQIRATAPAKARNLAYLDPIYTCEDEVYRTTFANYIEQRLDENIRNRQNSRSPYKKLNEKWSPLKMQTPDDDDNDADDAH